MPRGTKMPRGEMYYQTTSLRDFPRDYGTIDEGGIHPLVQRVMEEEEDFLSSPSGSPRFSRRSTRRELKKFRDTTSRRVPLRSTASWSPDLSRPGSTGECVNSESFLGSFCARKSSLPVC